MGRKDGWARGCKALLERKGVQAAPSPAIQLQTGGAQTTSSQTPLFSSPRHGRPGRSALCTSSEVTCSAFSQGRGAEERGPAGPAPSQAAHLPRPSPLPPPPVHEAGFPPPPGRGEPRGHRHGQRRRRRRIPPRPLPAALRESLPLPTTRCPASAEPASSLQARSEARRVRVGAGPVSRPA